MGLFYMLVFDFVCYLFVLLQEMYLLFCCHYHHMVINEHLPTSLSYLLWLIDPLGVLCFLGVPSHLCALTELYPTLGTLPANLFPDLFLPRIPPSSRILSS